MLEFEQRQRDTAREIFLRALQTTTVTAAIERNVCCDGEVLWVVGQEYDLALFSEVCIIALGKAGAVMFDAVDALLPETLRRTANRLVRDGIAVRIGNKGLIVPRAQHASLDSYDTVRRSYANIVRAVADLHRAGFDFTGY